MRSICRRRVSRQRRKLWWSGPTLVAALALTNACTAGDPGRLPTPAPTPTAEPASLVSAGVTALRQANTGRLFVRADTGALATEVSGVYRVAERAHRSEVMLSGDGSTTRRTSILRKGTVYVELTDADGDAPVTSTCWGVGRPGALRRFDGTFDVADATALPPALLAAGTAIGESLPEVRAGDVVSSGTEVIGTLDLFYVLDAFGTGRAADIGIEPDQERVAATLRLTDAALSGFTVTGSDLSEATLRAGTLLGAFPDEAVLEVEVREIGKAVDLGLPPEGRRFDVAADSGLLGLRDCLLERSASQDTVPIAFTTAR